MGCLIAAPVAAGPLTYDCDTAPEHFSELTQPLPAGPVTISGVLTARVMATSKTWASTGHVGLVSADGADYAQIEVTGVAKISKTVLLATLTVSRGGTKEEIELGPVTLMQALPFSLTWDPAGKLSVSLAGWQREVLLRPGTLTTAKATCSTGEFLFEKLELGAK